VIGEVQTCTHCTDLLVTQQEVNKNLLSRKELTELLESGHNS